MTAPATAAERATTFCGGGPGTVADVVAWAAELREKGGYAPIAPLLIAAARRSLYRGWEPEERLRLAKGMVSHQQFGYARRLFGRLRLEQPENRELRRQHAFCTYKDMELPAGRRLDRALEIITDGSPLEDRDGADVLGTAAAIYKRRWDVYVRRADLESARRLYERGFALEGDPKREYAGINAAFVCDQLAALEEKALWGADEARKLRDRATDIRTEIVADPPSDEWADATLGEAFLGLGRYEEAAECFQRLRGAERESWELETTAMQAVELGRLHGVGSAEMARVLGALLRAPEGALERSSGKVGLALSGGGFRASLFHIGVLARLAECGALRRVEVLSCVSGGSILGAYYYLKLRELLQEKPDAEITNLDYVELVRDVAAGFFEGVRQDLRGQIGTDVGKDWRMLASNYSRTDRVVELLERIFYSEIPKGPGAAPGPWKMTELFVNPAGTGAEGFSLRYDNWQRRAKVPMLVLNATSLNTGHSWQFTASWMGEPPSASAHPVDAMRRLRRVYYGDAPEAHREPPLALAVAASAAVPGVFPPVRLRDLYAGEDAGEPVDIELADGGVHDNQGIASLLEQDCTVVLISDASGQAPEDEHPSRTVYGVAKRANSVLMARVRGAQYEDLEARERAEILRGLMIVHLKKGLLAPPRDWSGCQEPYDREVDALPPAEAAEEENPYGIDRALQRALAELRTDLDRFSDEEAQALMAAGYAMTAKELRNALPELAEPDPALSAAARWPFSLERLGKPGELTDLLRVGHSQFFRRWRRRRLRRAQHLGVFRRLTGRTRLNRVPAAGGWALRKGVLGPARMVLAAPTAVFGAALARLYKGVEDS